MPEKPEETENKKIPTFEELKQRLGLEKMEFLTEMLRPTYKKGQGPQELEDAENQEK